MVVPLRLPHALASAALAVLFLPLVAATPEVRDTSRATVFVDGGSDSLQFADGYSGYPGTSLTVVAPDGSSIRFSSDGSATTGTPQRWTLGGARVSGDPGWSASGSLAGAPADGTWLVVVGGVYAAADVSTVASITPGLTLSVQGRAIHFGVFTGYPETLVQAWNWHQTAGTWTETSTASTLPITTVDLPNESPAEDPQFARFFAPLPDPVSQSLPGTSQSQTVPGQDVDTPAETVPATCTAAPCQSETPLVTPEHPVEETCVPPLVPVLCVGPFTVPPQDLGDAPAVCDVAGAICVGPIPVPAQDVVETNPVTVSLGFTGLDLFADPHTAELTTIGPFVEHVPVPGVGDVPVTVCPTTCPYPVAPDGSTDGSLTITVTVGAEQRSVTVPLGQSV